MPATITTNKVSNQNVQISYPMVKRQKIDNETAQPITQPKLDLEMPPKNPYRLLQ